MKKAYLLLETRLMNENPAFEFGFLVWVSIFERILKFCGVREFFIVYNSNFINN